YAGILKISVWSFTIVIASFLFLLAGCWVDTKLGTQPMFTFGLFMLGTMLSIGRLYWDAWTEMKKQ
ncbi:MAG: AtpZ/AtpI family protein, partial [Deltaproteobacteria bacterium]|nr:AtpZ/AtpI family protein [Deltaproteobacteria bacterium]